jgi:hypothetical protein
MYAHATHRERSGETSSTNTAAPQRAQAVVPVPTHRPHRLADVPLQRLVAVGGGSETKSKDLVDTIMLFTDFGETPLLVNAERFPGGNKAAAIIPPLLSVKTGTGFFGGSVDVTAVGEPVNFVDHRVDLPIDPPWSRNVGKDAAVVRVNAASANAFADRLEPLEKSEAATVDLVVTGLPNDGGFAALVKQHEEVHAAEIASLVQTNLTPWDTAIARLVNEKTRIREGSQPEATAELYRRAGGTPAQIGTRLIDDAGRRGRAFHHTAGGGSPTIDDVTVAGADTELPTLTVTYRHAMG